MLVGRVRYPASSESWNEQDRVITYLDNVLRSNVDFSVGQEYPSVFGDFPGGESFYIEQDGRVVSHAAMVVREFQHQDIRFRIGLIGSVVTASRYRGRGMAKAILASILQEMRKRHCLLALLWSDKPDFYQPIGFYPGGREADFRFCAEDVPTFPLKAVEYEPEQHAHVLWRLYQKHDVRLDRSLEEQKNLCRIPRARIFLTEREGKPTSYIVIHKGVDFENYVHEWGGDINDVQQNVAYVQRHFFPDENLTLIAPKHYNLGPLYRIASTNWDGILGLINVLDRAKVLAIYGNYLRSQGVSHSYDKKREVLCFAEKEVDVSTDYRVMKLVFGDNTTATFPVIPFFLWGLDSV